WCARSRSGTGARWRSATRRSVAPDSWSGSPPGASRRRVPARMAELSVVTFNTHYGLRSLHDHATPYDLGAVLGDLAADVMSIQEVWRPDGIRGVVDDFADQHGYVLHHVVTGRATC